MRESYEGMADANSEGNDTIVINGGTRVEDTEVRQSGLWGRQTHDKHSTRVRNQRSTSPYG
jgi:hypothetical protein